MASHRLSPLASRALMALCVYTFASWTMAAAVLLTWAPARAAATRTVARIATAWPSKRIVAPAYVTPFAIAPLAIAADNAQECAAACSETAPANEPSNGSWSQGEAAVDAELVSGDGSSFSYGYSDDDVAGDSFRWSLSGGEPDAEGNTRGRLRFRENGEEYVVRDPALVAEARRVAQPLEKLGREMGTLGAEMGRHGAEMGRLGGQMGAAGARLGEMQARLATGSYARAEREEVRAALEELRREMAQLRQDLGERQARHATRQRELSRRMSRLSAEHREVRREVNRQMREITRRALREGKAERPHANA